MNKENLKDIVCQSSSDYEILDNIYNYIEKLEKKVNQLEINWNELKEWLEIWKNIYKEHRKMAGSAHEDPVGYCRAGGSETAYEEALKYIKELERGKE